MIENYFLYNQKNLISCNIADMPRYAVEWIFEMSKSASSSFLLTRLSIVSIALLFCSLFGCTYKLSVVLTSAWPSIELTVFMSHLEAMRLVAKVWRRP